jgi:hypothetical protein
LTELVNDNVVVQNQLIAELVNYWFIHPLTYA